MKNKLKLFAIAFISLIIYFNDDAFSQNWSTTGNVITTTEWLGARATSTIPLDIRTIPALNINFSTSNAQRMTILGTGNVGYVGIGLTSPTSVLHIDGNGTPTATGEVFRTNAPAGLATWWRMLRGGTTYGNIYNNNDAHFYFEAPEGEARFNSFGIAASGGLKERLRLTSAQYNYPFISVTHNNVTRATISYGSTPPLGEVSSKSHCDGQLRPLIFYTGTSFNPLSLT